LALVSSGGLILTVSGLLLFLNLAMTVLASRRPAEVEVPEAEPLSPTPNMPLLLDRFRPWVVVTALLVVVAYGPMIVQLATTHPFDIPGRRLW
ncbi:MAG: cytochrome C oxidase subunit I, partial [Clostridia bacterium]|nr:cytochrome C oxidase subunit I [Clostridia bacterium]